jgi:transcriptional regulator with XRE-family HTH domain
MAKTRPDPDRELTPAERKRQAAARIDLGALIANRRRELKMTQSEVLTEVPAWSQTFLSELERGTASSGDIDSWMRVADALQLDRRIVLERVWETRKTMPLALPPRDDPNRETLLQLALNQLAGEVIRFP